MKYLLCTKHIAKYWGHRNKDDKFTNGSGVGDLKAPSYNTVLRLVCCGNEGATHYTIWGSGWSCNIQEIF